MVSLELEKALCSKSATASTAHYPLGCNTSWKQLNTVLSSKSIAAINGVVVEDWKRRHVAGEVQMM